MHWFELEATAALAHWVACGTVCFVSHFTNLGLGLGVLELFSCANAICEEANVLILPNAQTFLPPFGFGPSRAFPVQSGLLSQVTPPTYLQE